jgi:hypothetical protein
MVKVKRKHHKHIGAEWNHLISKQHRNTITGLFHRNEILEHSKKRKRR